MAYWSRAPHRVRPGLPADRVRPVSAPPSPQAPSRPWRRRALLVLAVVVAAGLAWTAWVWWSTEAALDRESLRSLEDRRTPQPGETETQVVDDVVNVLVVGSDSRGGLTEEQRRRLHTGDFDGTRTDTILLVQLRPDDGVSLLSFPRDLWVSVPGHGSRKINAAVELGGPDAIVVAVENLLDLDLDHFVQVAIPSFLKIVDAVGGVHLCLDEPLVDPKSGADFPAGCQDMDGPDALAYVRSRSGDRADFDRIERQQRFLEALVDRTSSLAVLSNPLRLQELAASVADGLTVDDQLDIPTMVDLARAGRNAVEEGLTIHTVPGYAERIDATDAIRPYRPGVEALASHLRGAQPLPERPDEDSRADQQVRLWTSGRPQKAARLESTLYYAGWQPRPAGPGPSDLRPTTTTVYVRDDTEDPQARAIADTLGATVEVLPDPTAVASDVDLVVATGTVTDPER